MLSREHETIQSFFQAGKLTFNSDQRVKSAAQVLSSSILMLVLLSVLEHCPRMSRQKYFLEYFSYIIIIIMLLLKTCQVLLEAGDTISDSDIDSILGLGGIDDGLSEEEVGSFSCRLIS